eukprot:TRINITY_DN7098_c0_g1_i17.p1 TRINITY_DN7098_c0_g1~~TRINITY_DN7098_c0_g1_i17.p1  ORF type:complete len:167 (+),score=42.18 TRINITY_DN7098_c0_g1_i17:70-501(+)
MCIRDSYYVIMRFTNGKPLNTRDYEIVWEPKSFNGWYMYNSWKSYVFGRSNQADYVYDASSYSRLQARFGFNEKRMRWVIADGGEDKGSANGTWRDLRKGPSYEETPEVALRPGDEVKIGATVVRFEVLGTQNQAPWMSHILS